MLGRHTGSESSYRRRPVSSHKKQPVQRTDKTNCILKNPLDTGLRRYDGTR